MVTADDLKRPGYYYAVWNNHFQGGRKVEILKVLNRPYGQTLELCVDTYSRNGLNTIADFIRRDQPDSVLFMAESLNGMYESAMMINESQALINAGPIDVTRTRNPEDATGEEYDTQ